MAIDHRNKRFSLMNLDEGHAEVLSTPSGVITTTARRMLLGLYAFQAGVSGLCRARLGLGIKLN